MKKYIAIILLSAFILSCQAAVYASEEGSSHVYSPSDNSTLDQTITTTLPEGKITWHLVIPADVEITKGGYIDGHTDIGKVSIVIDEGALTDKQQIEAYLKYDGELSESENGSGKILQYNLSPKNPTYSGEGEEYETWKTDGTLYKIGIRSKTNNNISSADAWVTLDDWAGALEGSYEGTIVYSSKLVETGE